MAQHHNWSLTELDALYPWEWDVYVGLLSNYVKEENERIKNANKAKG